jgi:hypothetical protein
MRKKPESFWPAAGAGDAGILNFNQIIHARKGTTEVGKRAAAC